MMHDTVQKNLLTTTMITTTAADFDCKPFMGFPSKPLWILV